MSKEFKSALLRAENAMRLHVDAVKGLADASEAVYVAMSAEAEAFRRMGEAARSADSVISEIADTVGHRMDAVITDWRKGKVELDAALASRDREYSRLVRKASAKKKKADLLRKEISKMVSTVFEFYRNAYTHGEKYAELNKFSSADSALADAMKQGFITENELDTAAFAEVQALFREGFEKRRDEIANLEKHHD